MWSFARFAATALFRIAIYWVSGSVALLADTIHNFGDAQLQHPLSCFYSVSKKTYKRFIYGYGRAEDLAGLLIVFLILFSAAFSA
jgi:divalent metal cation (Fe/Co/Zn/Cd) transporter